MRPSLFLRVLLLCLVALPLGAEENSTPLRYEIGVRAPNSHIFAVRLRVQEPGTDPLLLRLPSWTPGHYRLLDSARNLHDVSARDETGALPVQKVARNAWRVTPGDRPLTVTYEVYADGRELVEAGLDAGGGYWNGPALFLLPHGHRKKEVTVTWDLPDGWTLVASVPPSAESELQLPSYDALVDTPALLGPNLTIHPFEAHDRKFRIVLSDDAPPMPEGLDGLSRDLAAVYRVQRDVFGFSPFERYTFLIELEPRRSTGGGGLEHPNSTLIRFGSRVGWSDEEQYRDLLRLLAHELFHAWNIKALRPRQLQEYDYFTETYTTSLWLIEGGTSYYARLSVLRAGRLPLRTYATEIAEAINQMRASPAYRRTSLHKASFNAWQDPDDWRNRAISYYLKGELVGLLLDLKLRSAGTSLDRVLRKLYETHPDGYPDGAIRALASKMANRDLTPFFQRAVDETEPLDFATPLATVGLDVESGPKRPVLGVSTRRSEGGRPLIVSVEPDSGAAKAGLQRGDIILSLNGNDCLGQSLEAMVQLHRPGTRIPVTTLRSGAVSVVEVELGSRPGNVRIEVEENPARSRKAARAAWMGRPDK